MKIAIPVANTQGLNASLADSIGRADYFAIVELDDTSIEFIANPARQEGSGAGIKAVQTVANAKVKSVVVPRLGMKAIQALKDANISSLEFTGTTLQSAIDAFRAGQLKDFPPEGCGNKH